MTHKHNSSQATYRGCSYHTVYDRLLVDICELSGVPLGAPETITDEWLLKEAPKLDKQLLAWIEGSGELPEFPEWLLPLWERFQSTLDGKYLRYIRQLLLFCYKIEIEPTNEQLQEAQASFENTEADMSAWDSYFENLGHDFMFASARQIIARTVGSVDWSSIEPKHGPGAVYPSKKPCDKSSFGTIYTTIEQHYPYCDYLCALPSFWKEAVWDKQQSISVRDTIECRLKAVPKDSRGPRLICVHPSEAIWIQQGCRRLLERAILSKKLPIHESISFDDQKLNGSAALAASIDRKYCTLDLKEASDRISDKLVRYLFGAYTYEKISCARASSVRLLDNRVIPLRKWAPMGNCLTFPVQSLIFYSVVRSSIRCRHGITCDDIRVFGDDIIFPSCYYDCVLNGLVRAGLIPNLSKTFRHGFFRESCGVDAYRGIDVTPHRLKRIDIDSCSGAMSACSLAKRLRIDGYRLASDSLYRQVSRYWRLFLTNNPNAQGICRYEECSLVTLLKYEKSLRYNADSHKWQTRLLLVGGLKHVPVNDAWWHLQDSILQLAQKPEIGDGRGLEYPVPHRSQLNRGWVDAIIDLPSLLCRETYMAG